MDRKDLMINQSSESSNLWIYDFMDAVMYDVRMYKCIK